MWTNYGSHNETQCNEQERNETMSRHTKASRSIKLKKESKLQNKLLSSVLVLLWAKRTQTRDNNSGCLWERKRGKGYGAVRLTFHYVLFYTWSISEDKFLEAIITMFKGTCILNVVRWCQNSFQRNCTDFLLLIM